MNKLQLNSTIAANFALANTDKLSASAEKSAQKLRFTEGEAVITHNAGASALSSKVDLLDVNSTKRLPGLSDFDDSLKMEAYKNVVGNQIFFGVAENANNNNEDAVNYSNLRSDVANELRNAVLVMKQDDKDIVRRRVDSLLVGGDNVKSQPVPFDDLKLLAGDVETEVFLEFPQGTSYQTATAAHYAYFQLRFIGQTTSLSTMTYKRA